MAASSDVHLRILDWLGIVDQLATTRANRILAGGAMPLPQFAMLHHFAQEPGEGQTVTGLAAAFAQPQPGVTKTVQKLLAQGWVEARPDKGDRRIKHLFLTQKGRAAHARAAALLGPELDRLFAGWDSGDLATLFAYLDVLKERLDAPEE